MILGNRRLQEQDQEKKWCVVLNPLESEMDRKRMSSKLAEVFSISLEESHDLVRSTPIILLDHLTKSMADKIKEYFSPMNAELVISKDTLFKRKCYRTLWPQAPTLSFLHHLEEAAEPVQPNQEQLKKPEELLRPEDALNEIRKSMQPIEKERLPHLVEQSKLAESKTMSKEEVKKELSGHFSYADLMDKQKTKSEFQPTIMPSFSGSDPLPQATSLKPSSNPPVTSQTPQDLSQWRKNLQQVEARYEALKVEYRDSRSVFEEKIAQARLDNESLRRKMEEVVEGYQTLQKDKQKWVSEFQERASFFMQSAQQVQDAQSKFKNDQDRLAQEFEKFQAEFQSLNARVGAFESGKQAMERTFLEISEKAKALFSQWQQESVKLTQQVEHLGTQFTTAQGHLKQFENFKEKIENSLLDHDTVLGGLKQGLEQMEKSVAESLVREREERAARELIQRKQQDLEKAQEVFKKEVSGSTKEWVRTELQGFDFDRKFSSFFELFQKQYEMLEAILKHLMIRESQRGLEPITPESSSALTDPKMSSAQKEQQKYWVARLGDKESLLKRLVAEQEKIEKDIMDREEEMRRVISDQQKIEKEILEVRQSQRQWSEYGKLR